MLHNILVYAMCDYVYLISKFVLAQILLFITVCHMCPLGKYSRFKTKFLKKHRIYHLWILSTILIKIIITYKIGFDMYNKKTFKIFNVFYFCVIKTSSKSISTQLR